jgi:two-component system chemotaxis sensor kinase CheA
MPSDAVVVLMEALAEDILLADENDLPRLAKMQEALLTISSSALPTDAGALADAAKRASEQLLNILMRDDADAAGTLRQIARVIRQLQAVIVDGQPVGDLQELAAPVVAPAAPPPPPAAPATAQTAEPTAASMEELPASGLLTGDPQLLAEFVRESKEHLDSVDASLLTLETNAHDTEALNALFRAFHTIKGVAGFLELPAIRALAHECETLLDRGRRGALILAGPVLDLTFEAADQMKALVHGVEEAMTRNQPLTLSPQYAPLLLRVKEAAQSGNVSAPPAATAATAAAAASTPAANAAPPPAPAPEPAALAVGDGEAGKPGAARGTAVVKETVRVDAERLDKLVDTIGEMVIAEAMVSQLVEAAAKASPRLGRTVNHLNKITRALQELAMSLRMVPVRSTFQRMAKLARDVSKKLNKPIDFVTTGEDTELDKNVVDAIGDPLVHMIRNAVDHGLEASPQDRSAAGKPAQGRIELRAFHKGGSIYIEIEDDGRGIDRDAILAKARERGLVEEGQTLTESEVFGLIFEPGFSTAKQITDLSGRGVGLDVVKRNIQALRGKVEIRSVKGKGSVFSIRLPLTLAIIEGMVVRVAQQRYVVPTLAIVRMIRPGETDINTLFERGQMLKLGDRLVPLFGLGELFDIQGAVANPCQAAVVVVEHDNRQVAFVVDELLGQQQIVIKPLGAALRKYPGFTGGAIMPDGRVGLILDVAGLTAMANGEENRHAA